MTPTGTGHTMKQPVTQMKHHVHHTHGCNKLSIAVYSCSIKLALKAFKSIAAAVLAVRSEHDQIPPYKLDAAENMVFALCVWGSSSWLPKLILHSTL